MVRCNLLYFQGGPIEGYLQTILSIPLISGAQITFTWLEVKAPGRWTSFSEVEIKNLAPRP